MVSEHMVRVGDVVMGQALRPTEAISQVAVEEPGCSFLVGRTA